MPPTPRGTLAEGRLSLFAKGERVKGQDILVMLKLAANPGKAWSYPKLAQELRMSVSETHSAVARCAQAHLYNPHSRSPLNSSLLEFLVHGIRYVFPATPGPIVNGLYTGFAAPPLSQDLRFEGSEAPVMPFLDGPHRGPGIKPIYPTAPEAAWDDPALYNLLALVDAIRTGRSRERKLAQAKLTEALS